MKYPIIRMRSLQFLAFIVFTAALQWHCQTKSTTADKDTTAVTNQSNTQASRLMNASPDALTSIAYTNATKKMHVITSIDGKWHYAGMELLEADKVNAYLGGLTSAQSADHVDSAVLLDHPWQEKLIIEGEGLMKPVILTAYQIGADIYLVHSTETPAIAYRSDSNGLYKQLFTDLTSLLP